MPSEEELSAAIRGCEADGAEQLLGLYYELAETRLGGISALLFACHLGRADVARAIARRRRLDVFEAAALGDINALTARLDEEPERADAVGADGYRPLGIACYFGREEAARLLIERHAEVAAPSRNPARMTPLHAAVRAGRPAIAALLLQRGAPVDARQMAGYAPLMLAALEGQTALAELLLEHGADPRLLDEFGKTAADHARDAGHAALARRLDELCRA